MKRSKRLISALCICALSVSMFGSTGCNVKDPDKTTKEPTTTAAPTNTPTPTNTSTPTPTPDPAVIIKNDALVLAAKIGMPEESLREKYELFLEYMDCVNENPSLNEYRGYVAQLFPVVADHLKEENKEYFFGRVRQLLCETQQLETTNAGIFYSDDLYVKVSDTEVMHGENYYCATAFHELMHFLDYNIDGEHSNQAVYVGDKFIRFEDMTDDDWNLSTDFLESSFITEGGAELFTAKYFIGSTLTYTPLVNFLTGLELIFDSDMVAELFYTGDSTMEFIKLMQENGFDDKSIIKMIRSFNYYTYPTCYSEPDYPVYFEDVLIELYQKKKGDGWKEDKVFCHILNCIRQNYAHAGECENEEFLKTLSDDYEYWNLWRLAILEQVETDKDLSFWYLTPDVMCVDGKFCVSARMYYDEMDVGMMMGSLTCDYDFETGKVNSYYYTEMPCPKKVPDPLPKGKELDERLKSFEHDPSDMHKQDVKKGNISALETLYAKATEIGNKYGVKILIGDLVPEEYHWMQPDPYDDNMCKQLEEALTQIDTTLAKFPEGYYDQLNYGYWSGISIILIGSDVDMFARRAFCDGEDYYMGICLHATEYSSKKLEEDLIKGIFYYTEMRIRNVSENMEEPVFTDAEWKKFNFDGFMYRGDNTPEWIEQYYEDSKDFVVSKEAMDSSYSDRFCLMEYLFRAANDPEIGIIDWPCLNKGEYFCKCIRECFDTSSWPEELPWEKGLADLKERREKESEQAA